MLITHTALELFLTQAVLLLNLAPLKLLEPLLHALSTFAVTLHNSCNVLLVNTRVTILVAALTVLEVKSVMLVLQTQVLTSILLEVTMMPQVMALIL